MALNENLGEAIIQIRAKMDSLDNDLKKMTSKTGSAAKEVSGQFEKAAMAIKAALVISTVKTLIADFLELAKSIDEIGDAAQRMGLTTKAFQELAFAAKLSGADIGNIQMGMAQFTDKLTGVAQGSKEASNALIQLAQASGQSINLQDRAKGFQDVIQALSKISDETQRAQLAMQILGTRSAQALLPMINSLGETNQAQKDYNLTIEGPTIASFGKLVDALDTAKTSFVVMMAEALKPVAEALTVVVKGITSITSALSQWVKAGGEGSPFDKSMKAFQKQQVDNGTAVKDVSKEIDTLTSKDGKTVSVAVSVGTPGQKNTNAGADVQRQIKELQAAEAKKRAIQDQQELADSFRVDVRNSFAGGITDAVKSGDLKSGLESFFDGVFTAITNKFANQIADAVFGTTGKGNEGMIGQIVAGIFGAATGSPSATPGSMDATGGGAPGTVAAVGGNVGAGRPVLVGEQGPEIFTPNSRGGITPNHELGGGGTTVVMHNNFTGVNSVNRQELARAMAQMEAKIPQVVGSKARNGGSFSKTLRG